MCQPHETHLLEHVAVVIDAGLIYSETNSEAMRQKCLHGRNPTLEAEIGTAIVANAASGLRNPLDLFFVDPHRMTKGHSRAQQPKFLEIPNRAIATPSRILLLVT